MVCRRRDEDNVNSIVLKITLTEGTIIDHQRNMMSIYMRLIL